MNDFILLIGYFGTAAVVILVSVIVLERYWGTSKLRWLVKPKQPLFYEGRPCWTKEPLKAQVLGLPVVAALLTYILLLKPELLLLHSILLVPIWIYANMISLLEVVNCRAKSKGTDKSEGHGESPS